MKIWVTLLIVIITYIGIALGKFPTFRANRTTIALMGVGALLGAGQIAFDQLGRFLDLNTLVLLFGMMIINANLQLAGFFRLAGATILHFTHTPRGLLALLIAISGVLSALFLNDTVCLMLTPLVLDITLGAKRNPVPYLIGLATAANIGSVALLTGNPQNMIIGIASKISYLAFARALAPIALLGLGTIWLVLLWFYPQEFRSGRFDIVALDEPRIYRPLFYKSLLVSAGLLLGFLFGLPIAESALIAACILLLTRRIHPDKIMSRVDWNLLVFFSALFIVSGALETSGIATPLYASVSRSINQGPFNLSMMTVVLSNLISNVPAVLLLRPLIPQLSNPQAGWLTLAATSTLAGNLTLLGSVANLIVVEIAARRNVRLTFWEYTKPGVLITLASLVIGVGWIWLFLWK